VPTAPKRLRGTQAQRAYEMKVSSLTHHDSLLFLGASHTRDVFSLERKRPHSRPPSIVDAASRTCGLLSWSAKSVRISLTLASCCAALPKSPMALRREARTPSPVAVWISASSACATTSAGSSAVGGGAGGAVCRLRPGCPPASPRVAIQSWVSCVHSPLDVYKSRKSWL